MPCFYSFSVCEGELWTCQTCQEEFCQTHTHTTDLGVNVECAGCEHDRKNPPPPATDDLPEIRRLDKLDEQIDRLNSMPDKH